MTYYSEMVKFRKNQLLRQILFYINNSNNHAITPWQGFIVISIKIQVNSQIQ